MIGENIVRIRKKKGYTLSKLAKQTKISKSNLSNIERNLNKNPSLQIMMKIATVLNVDLEALLKNDSNKDAYTNLEKEWVDFVNELKELGVEKSEIHQYRTLIEFIKWQNQNLNTK